MGLREGPSGAFGIHTLMMVKRAAQLRRCADPQTHLRSISLARRSLQPLRLLGGTRSASWSASGPCSFGRCSVWTGLRGGQQRLSICACPEVRDCVLMEMALVVCLCVCVCQGFGDLPQRRQFPSLASSVPETFQIWLLSDAGKVISFGRLFSCSAVS